MISIIFLLIIAITSSHGGSSEALIRQNRPLSSPTFDEIIVDGSFDVFLKQSDETPVSTVDVETTASIQSHIVVKILDNHILSIYFDTPISMQQNVNLYIGFKAPLKRYTIKGVGNTVTDEHGLINNGTEKFVLDNGGTANVAMPLNVNEFEYHLAGTGNARFWGQVREQISYDIEGVGDINAMHLLTKIVKVQTSGVNTIRVAATDDVQIEATGVSTVYYRLPAGKHPSKTTTEGLGKLIRMH